MDALIYISISLLGLGCLILYFISPGFLFGGDEDDLCDLRSRSKTRSHNPAETNPPGKV